MSQPTASPHFAYAPDAMLSFTVQGGFLTSNWIAPTLTIDGSPAPVPAAGTRRIPVRSGRHRLQVHSQWLRAYGHATLEVDVPPGETVEVYYGPPHQNFINDGSMGLGPQVRMGRGYVVAVWTTLGLLWLGTLGVIYLGGWLTILRGITGG